MTILLNQVKKLSAEVSSLRDWNGDRLVTEKELIHETGIPRSEIRRLRLTGAIKGYAGTQPIKKRFLFNLAEATAAIQRKGQPAINRLAFDDEKLFRSYNIPTSLALSGVN